MPTMMPVALLAQLTTPRGKTVGRGEETLRTFAALETAWNTERMVQMQQTMVHQLSHLLGISAEQLAVQRQQLNVQEQIRSLAADNLAVNQEQLACAIQTVSRLDVTNQRLTELSTSLTEVSGLLARQNALFQESMNRLANESRERIERGVTAYKNAWLDEARNDFVQAIEKDPYSPVAYYYLGKCLLNLGDKPGAKQAYHKCITYAGTAQPLLLCLAYCDVASLALSEDDMESARQWLDAAMQCRDRHPTIIALALLEYDVAAGALTPQTRQAVAAAFADENVEPWWLLTKLESLVPQSGKGKAKLKSDLQGELKTWQRTAKQAAFDQQISHFYRELDDFVYLARRIRRAFMDSADARFLSLGEPLADLLDWTAGIGERLSAKITCFTLTHLPILPLHQVLRPWNDTLLEIAKLANRLDSKADLVSGRFVQKLNLGLLELPAVYEDDRILFEAVTDEKDTIALSCYYAIFVRDNGVQHFCVPLRDYGQLRIDTYPARAGAKGVIVTDLRNGQVLVHGVTGSFENEQRETVFSIDLFREVGGLLAELHQRIQWVIEHEEQLFAWFRLLDCVTNRLSGALPAQQRPDDDFEVVDDDEFEVVE